MSSTNITSGTPPTQVDDMKFQGDFEGQSTSFSLPTASIASMWFTLRQQFPSMPFIPLRLTYLDEDGEEVEMETDSDLADALQQASGRSPKNLQVFVRQPIHSSGLQRSSLLGGEGWESVGSAASPALVPRVVDAAAAPIIEQPLEPVAVASPVVEKVETPAVIASPVVEAPAVVAAPAAIPAPVPAPASVPASSPSAGVFGWIWGVKAPAPVAVAAPVEATAVQPPIAEAVVAPSASPASAIATSSADLSASIPLSSSGLAAREFWEDEDADSRTPVNEPQSANSFVAAMDELANSQDHAQRQPGYKGLRMCDSGIRTQYAIGAVMQQML